MDDEVRLQPDAEDPGLADTVVDVDALEEEDEAEAVLTPQRSERPQSPFVPIGEHEIAGLDRLDPEWGKYDVSRRITSLRQAVETSFAQMIFAGIAALVALAVALLAASWQTRALIIAASVLCPPTFVWVYIQWRRWLERKRFLFRLLETLGEDTTGIDPRPRRVRRRVPRPISDDEA